MLFLIGLPGERQPAALAWTGSLPTTTMPSLVATKAANSSAYLPRSVALFVGGTAGIGQVRSLDSQIRCASIERFP